MRKLAIAMLVMCGLLLWSPAAYCSDTDAATAAAHGVSTGVTAADQASLVFGQLPDKYAPCRPLLTHVDRAARLWSPHYPYPMQWLGQVWQESRCRLDAVSPAGAGGPAQFMPATCAEEWARHGLVCDPFDPIAVEIGLAFLVRYGEGFWTAGLRGPAETRRWAQGCYNAGCGTVLAAQRRAQADLGRAVTVFAEIGPYLPEETRLYVPFNERWWAELCAPADALCAPVMLRMEWRR